MTRRRVLVMALVLAAMLNAASATSFEYHHYHHQQQQQIEPTFIYYQNYEYMSSIKLNEYSGYYGNVKLLRYTLPSDVLLSMWRLQLLATDACAPTYVYFYLDYAAYPVISPQNRSFPQYFSTGRLTKLYIKQLIGGATDSSANRQDVFINVSSPQSGHWFSAAFIDSTGTHHQQVKPDLLRTNCSIYLTASINLWKINYTHELHPAQLVSSHEHSIFKIYKYLSSSNFYTPVVVTLNTTTTAQTSCNLTALLRQSAFPDMVTYRNNDDFMLCTTSNVSSNMTNVRSASQCKLTVDYPLTSTFYYLAVSSTCAYSITVDQPQGLLSAAPIPTFRYIGPSFFGVKYYFNSNYNRSNTLLVQHDQRPYFIEFLVDQANNGGTLNFLLVNNLVVDSGYAAAAAETTSASTTTLAPNASNHSSSSSATLTMMAQAAAAASGNVYTDIRVTLNACILYNSMSAYKKCPDGYGMSTQSYRSMLTSLQMNIAYPMQGKWYFALWKECHNTTSNSTVACPTDLVPFAIIQIASDQCANDYCGDYGTCYIINSQLNLVSACKCSGGYEGYGCTDGRNAIPSSTYLASVLFLTMSNLVFLLPICLALYRRWYIESLIYFYNMFFSTFYHACDQEFYSFCIFNYDGLQLADFISSYTSFIITILSMSSFSRPWKVFTFFVGLLACLSINLYDRFNNWAFIAFLCVAISVTISTWIRICVTQKHFYPKRKTIFKYYVPGFSLALSGLLIYSFLQTKSNYWILHSIWHMCMASSIIFFMPKRDRSLSSKNSSSSSSSSNNGKVIFSLDDEEDGAAEPVVVSDGNLVNGGTPSTTVAAAGRTDTSTTTIINVASSSSTSSASSGSPTSSSSSRNSESENQQANKDLSGLRDSPMQTVLSSNTCNSSSLLIDNKSAKC